MIKTRMFQDAYVKLDTQETKNLVQSLSPRFDGGSFDPGSTIVMARRLPFYKNSRFLDVADHRIMPPSRRFAIQIGDAATILDFTNAPIYDLNKSVPIFLNEDTVLEYIRFFFSFVRGRHGRFIVVESVDDIPWREEPAPTARKAIGKMVAPVTLTGVEAGYYRLTIHVVFKDSLFQTQVSVASDGRVRILEEMLLVDDIPVIDDTLGQ